MIHSKKSEDSSRDRKGDAAGPSNSRRGDAYISIAMPAGNQTSRTDDWWMDSGASDHMSYKREWFIEYERFEKPCPVRIGNGTKIFAYGKGCINILSYDGTQWCEKHLLDVLYVPDIHLNLFSVITTLDKGLKLEADNQKCKYLKRNETVGIGVREGGLFRMMFKVIPNDIQNSMACLATGLKIWHERLGHQNVFHVKKFLKKTVFHSMIKMIFFVKLV